MKTRELLTCDTRVLESKVQDLKPKELRRHIDRIAAGLGAPDTDTLLGRILEATLSLADPLETEDAEKVRDEAETIVLSLEGHIEVTDENRDPVLRLMVISMAFLRHVMDRRVKELRRTRPEGHLHAHHHPEGDQCADPHCQEHGDALGARAQPEPGPLASIAPGPLD